AATPEVLAALTALLRSPDRNIRQSAAQAIGRLGAAAAGDALRSALPDLSPVVRPVIWFRILPRWPEGRLFQRGEGWDLVPVAGLVAGRLPASKTICRRKRDRFGRFTAEATKVKG